MSDVFIVKRCLTLIALTEIVSLISYRLRDFLELKYFDKMLGSSLSFAAISFF